MKKVYRFIAKNISTFNDRYRTDAAGLSIAYHFERRPFSNPTLLIKNCEFNNNHAVAVSSDISDQIDNTIGGGTCLKVEGARKILTETDLIEYNDCDYSQYCLMILFN